VRPHCDRFLLNRSMCPKLLCSFSLIGAAAFHRSHCRFLLSLLLACALVSSIASHFGLFLFSVTRVASILPVQYRSAGGDSWKLRVT
jgi:hypothetical protein